MRVSSRGKRLTNAAFLDFLVEKQRSPDFDLQKALGDENTESQDNIQPLLGENVIQNRSRRKPISRLSWGECETKPEEPKTTTDQTTTPEPASDGTIPPFYQALSAPPKSVLCDLYKPDDKINLKTLADILRTKLSLPGFFALPFMVSLDPQIMKTRRFEIPYSLFLDFALPKLEHCQLYEKVFNIIVGRNDRDYLVQSDLAPYFAALIHTHQSLKFLETEPTLQSSFAKCIIARTFYALDPELRGRITKRALANSNFCQCLLAVDTANDVSDVADFFSYEHFYVIVSKMWQLDEDDVGTISIEKLATYDDSRIPLPLVRRFVNLLPGSREPEKVSFVDFVYFLTAVEDKTTETALRLWYKVCDLDDDGILSFHELDRLYEFQKEKGEKLGTEPVPYAHVLSQMLDLIEHVDTGITLSQLRRTKDREMFLNAFVDFKKFHQAEVKDPLFEMNMKGKFSGMKEWDVFCQFEYARLSQAG